MTRRDKRIEAMRKNPTQVTPDEMDTVLQGLGFTIRGGKGSHQAYVHPNLDHPVVIAVRRPQLKRYIVLQALEAIDELQEKTEVKEETEP